ncbi:16S rRNA (cytosine(1402)-N(4))-methyltransferase RsmH [Ureaplasma parvum]|uniref:16S rRNA (cytosine(1402)-N(4))-methyltransferase RsmH n=1 Tax=Ureaplasma parvum TaxID=134821 RepID=UPI000173B9DB|nr:16S rRNA (cytosine(1402)-N(4))-methyltransferase RsmH [Ureaplasma parvum]EDU19238.1 S-adenosyl-methyltransferase MraW [Ureaplasma parvum serovar 6 str. ATCC 27818]MDU7891470.1 16S rRNA (cytosine(1402)-N(4))-methyltransferase RsmH [Ureaplasma parvum]QDI64370.1 16S rRNA (cytosine(1402)-N(4))-methyltransferase RsmH [Ureaplasma parvum]
MEFNQHITVLLNETIELLNIKPDGIYVDCTFGRGGHSQLILKKLSKKGKLICLDQDQEAINFANNLFKNNTNVIVIKTNFKNLKSALGAHKIFYVDGFIFDLGLSSPQLDDPKRGFSYHKNAWLDMRMDQSQNLNAHYIVNNYSFAKLVSIFKRYGEIKYPKIIADAIVKERSIKEINTTLELVEIIKKYSPKKNLFEKKHPARLFFQAIRIEVNDELNILEKAFNDAISMLNPLGVVAIISFHSLEDKIVKKVFNNYAKIKLPKEVPINNYVNKYSLLNQKIMPSTQELNDNNRSRSSILRGLIRNY